MNLILKKFLVITIVVYNAVFINCDNLEELNLKCTQGELEGTFLKTQDGREIRAFMSIPYAEPPVGKLRFKAPVPLKKWDGVLDATRVHDVCIQKDFLTNTDIISGVEDCLYLNVYTPKKSDMKKVLPVMMFIHGGAYINGVGNLYLYGPETLLDQDIVLVVLNYRLGPFGFISTGDDVFPGNNGLKDQSVALKWIFDNIKEFGGDPNQITVFGESAGAASTHLHMLSPMSRDMIKRGISQSGSALAPWTIAQPGEAKKNAHKLAALLNCPTSSSNKMLDCLQKVKAYRIVDMDKMFIEWDYDPVIPFKPVVEHDHPGAFLKEQPEDIIKSRKLDNIPWMVGINSDEGAIKSAKLLIEQHRVDQLNDDFERLAVYTLCLQNFTDVTSVTKSIKDFYFGGNKKISRETQQTLTDMYTDAWFLNNMDYAVNLYRKFVRNDIYLYKFTHRGVASFTDLLGDKLNDYGVCHVDDLLYLFPMKALFPEKANDELDRQMSKHMSTLWTNFARAGVPTPQWTTVKSDRLEYYRLDVPEKCHMDTDMFSDRVNFWRGLTLTNINSAKDEL